jgi:DDE superfamily endonuclease
MVDMANHLAPLLAVSESEVETLRAMVRAGTIEQRTALRAEVILRAADGIANVAIAGELEVSVPTVGLRRSRFRKRGLSISSPGPVRAARSTSFLDDVSTHKKPGIQKWLARHKCFHFHFTPTSESSMNPVETWFGILSRQAISRGSFACVRVLIAAIERFTRQWNDGGSPFMWVKTPDEILVQAERKAQSTSGARRLVSRFAVGSWLADGLGEDLVGGLDPHERARSVIPGTGEGSDPGDECPDAPKAASPDGLPGEDAEPGLDLVHSGRRRRGEVEGDPRMTRQPGLHLGGLVGGHVVEHDVQVHSRVRSLHAPQEGQRYPLDISGTAH